jgi:phage protein D
MATLKPAYRLTLGSTTIDSGAVLSARLVLALRADADLATPAAALDAWLGNPQGISVVPGDAAKLEAGYDTSLTTVFTGTVERVQPDLAQLHIQALSDVTHLLRLRVNQVYDNQTAGQIVSDLAGQAGISTGTIQDGLDLPFYMVDDARQAYHHCRDLAERSGFDLYTTPDGQLTFAAFNKLTPDHVFIYAQDVLRLEVATAPQPVQRVEVWGESPASVEGVEAASWLTRDFSDALGAAGSGTTLRLSDPAIRTRDAAQASAAGRLAVVTRRSTFGVAIVLGAAEVALGDAVTFLRTPDNRLSGVLQVKRVTHSCSKTDGFTTRLELWGSGGGLGGLG